MRIKKCDKFLCNRAGPCIGVEKTRMKVVLLFLLVAGPFGVGYGQTVRLAPKLPLPGWRPAPVFIGDSAGRTLLVTLKGDSVRQLQPDRMPCLVPNMRRVERMPVDRRGNVDRMQKAPGRAPKK